MFKLFQRSPKTAPPYHTKFQAEAQQIAAARPDIYDQSRAYHRAVPPGKMATVTTKSLSDQNDLALAYSPGVAGPCRSIESDPAAAYHMTNKGNTVAIISNGTAVLGLGDIGALAAKPVMEGKAALFRSFAGIDAVDICIDEKNPEKLASIIASLGASFGGINLEDIKAPDCFIVEEFCKANMDIPVFHDDQHGTATVILAGLINALQLTGRRLDNISLVVSGAGAAAIATLDLLCAYGLHKDQITLFDSQGCVTTKRKSLEPRRGAYAKKGAAPKSLSKALQGADIFLGVSKAGTLNPAWIGKMAANPIIFALANPEPEIWPAHALEVMPSAIVATGRSDFPNQVNNVLCFPFLFRGVLDTQASEVTQGMQIAAAKAIAALAHTQPGQETIAAYPEENFTFGQHYILPKPFDKRLSEAVPTAVAEAAVLDGVARL